MMTKPMIFATRRIPGTALERLAGQCALRLNAEDRDLDREELLAGVRGAEGLLSMLGNAVDGELMDAAGSQLKVVSNYAVGYNNIDVTEASRRGIMVTNTPGVLTEATAAMAWTLLLAAARRIIEGDRMVRTGGFLGWAPNMLLGADIQGRILGIIGLGRIGEAMVAPAKGFGLEVLYYDANRRSPEDEARLGVRYLPLPNLLAAADFITIHVPLLPQTRHLIDAGAFRLMKPTAILVNTSRGPVVDEAALVEALQDGRIAGAGLDVYEDEPRLAPGLAQCARAVLAPHLGSATLDTRGRMAEMAVDSLLDGLNGRRPRHLVNPQILGES